MSDALSATELAKTCRMAYQYILDTSAVGREGDRLTRGQQVELGARLFEVWARTSDKSSGDEIGSPQPSVSVNWLATRAEWIIDQLTSMKSSDPKADTKPADRVAFMRRSKGGEHNLGGANHACMVSELQEHLQKMLHSLGIKVVTV